MRTQVFFRLMAQLEQLTPQQGQTVQEKVIQIQGRYALATLGEARMAEQRGCSRCGAEHLQHWGRTGSGQQRYRCSRCGHSMTALSGTPLARLHGKALLPRHAECMTVSLSLRQVAQTLGIHRNTAFRWRHRMMPLLAAHQPAQLTGVVESDEIFIRRSYKGSEPLCRVRLTIAAKQPRPAAPRPPGIWPSCPRWREIPMPACCPSCRACPTLKKSPPSSARDSMGMRPFCALTRPPGIAPWLGTSRSNSTGLPDSSTLKGHSIFRISMPCTVASVPGWPLFAASRAVISTATSPGSVSSNRTPPPHQKPRCSLIPSD